MPLPASTISFKALKNNKKRGPGRIALGPRFSCSPATAPELDLVAFQAVRASISTFKLKADWMRSLFALAPNTSTDISS